MGNILSGSSTNETATVVSDQILRETETMENVIGDNDEHEDCIDTLEDDNRVKKREEDMNEFMKQLTIKREQRKEILLRHRNEKKELEKSLENEIKCKLELIERNTLLRELLTKNNISIPNELQAFKENSDLANTILQLKEEVEKLKSNNNKLRCELASSNNALQSAYSDIAELSLQNTESLKQISSLKEVITVSKTMINLREQQLNELKNKLNEIEQSLADRETHILSTDLRQEYERQLQNIRTLRVLYEERARLAEVTRQTLTKELQEQKELNQAEIKKCNDFKLKVEELEKTISELEEEIQDKNNQMLSFENEARTLKAEMEVVNKLFSQVLLGYKNKQDLDKLVNRLEENHGLLLQMAERENGSEASSALPKLLLQLVTQIEETDEKKLSEMATKSVEETEVNKQKDKADIQTLGSTSAEEIVQNLPKVWKVLIELLSHQTEPDTNNVDKITTCYKSVETKSGPVLVPSVSQTYIRLKDLIVEKLTLIKEVNRMKQLNGHLETRLQEQERRLCLVTTELSKTWHVVGRLRRHHHQLHTHEKILKYELQQKRKLLNELKEELEYCREKWEQAREKNSQSENDWKNLREEFSSRKLKPISTFINNSGESGYSDERPSDDSSESNDESEYVKEPQIRCKKKLKKSFEPVIDSSADFNLAAEREDPVSDMMDVADLPLDNQDPESFEVSDCCNNDQVNSEHEKTYVETEDYIGDFPNDPCSEEPLMTENCNVNRPSYHNPNKFNIEDKENPSNNFKDQNESLTRKDKKSELEKGSTSLPKRTVTSFKSNENSALDYFTNQPSSSKQNIDLVSEDTSKLLENSVYDECCIQDSHLVTTPNIKQKNDKHIQIIESTSSVTKNNTTENPGLRNDSVTSLLETNKFKEILEDINRQKDHLLIKDQKLQNLENNTANVLNSLTSSIQKGNQISEKLETLHTEYNKLQNDQQSGQPVTDVTKNTTIEKSEPSTSNDLDHEAIFAARDLRLKRLEEQTKSLVNKVNRTATKGVKINYKLDELHNIYGSESSRAGTPSEESEDNSQNSGKENDDR